MIIKFGIVLALTFSICALSSAQRQLHVVYLGEHNEQKSPEEIVDTHHSYLTSALGSLEEAQSSIFRSYTKVINGFSAFLTTEEADAISGMDGVVTVFPDTPVELHTTRSWDFISLLESNWNAKQAGGLEQILDKAKYGKDVIVGVLDTGIWPESRSFDDAGMDPIPTSWKGICQTGQNFTASHCNRKLIGARYYLTGYEAKFGPLNTTVNIRSARDTSGHGSHTSSTIGGRRVANASAIGGFGKGVAIGGAPLVRLAVYKICWFKGCMDSDVLSAFDDAIADGVHIISSSIGSSSSRPYNQDGLAIGSLLAARKNIVVSVSAGNSGPRPGTVSNVAPWLISVGASSIDRVFSSPLGLGNNEQAQGQSVATTQEAKFPLVYARDIEVPGSTTSQTTGKCAIGTLSADLAKGKAVFCLGGGPVQASEVHRAGGAAVVLQNGFTGIGVLVEPYALPSTTVLSNETQKIMNYINSSKAATAKFTPARTLIGGKPAPFMALFSSRGPNAIDANILKPDITAPGLNILAAWSAAASPSVEAFDRRVAEFSINSGTSMSCPHISGVAALLKAIHPTWSSAAIQSAIMTSAKVTDNTGKLMENQLQEPATPFEYGSGHIQPSKAADPGLVYNSSYTDYLLFICSSIGKSLDSSFSCPSNPPSSSSLNYPSLAIANVQGVTIIKRTVTNVGNKTSSYSVTIDEPEGYSVVIFPSRLVFFPPGHSRSFTITVTAKGSVVRNQFAFGSYTWKDNYGHVVRSPIALSTASRG
ncbi:subtilisin-like protease SBT5.6 [Andrographis paniculata]|uniref:subtilisin-like protease SBT5.6 n=1 Tax=Andrographis paniculata TaxID=175694 RepID=UPI0021E8EDE3|nr:subtilisin-like protease SBT5.6 [Andrographis paniculata]